MATSRALIVFSSSGLEPGQRLSPRYLLFRPEALNNLASVIPHSLSWAVIVSTKALSDPEIFSARAIAALLALEMRVASRSCLTVYFRESSGTFETSESTVKLKGQSEISTSVSQVIFPWSTALQTMQAVRILVIEATPSGVVASFSQRTFPVVASIAIACLAETLKSSVCSCARAGVTRPSKIKAIIMMCCNFFIVIPLSLISVYYITKRLKYLRERESQLLTYVGALPFLTILW